MRREFHVRFCEGPGVRFPRATRLVVLARYQGNRLRAWIERVLEARMGLEINQDKTKVVDLKEKGVSLDFLGFTFRYDRDFKGRDHRYLNVFPSKKAVDKERERLRSMTHKGWCFLPIPALIQVLNRHRRDWANYFNFGYPRKVLRDLNHYVQLRLYAHLGRRSQRRYRPPKDVSFYRHFIDLGLVNL